MMALTSADRRKLVGVLGMLGSDADGERAAAGLLASRIVKAAGTTWCELLGADTSTAPDASIQSETNLAAYRRYPGLLTEWERSFVASVGRRRNPMTAKQAATLATIAAELERRCKR